MKHYYRIGEISRLYGVGPDSLRYYEELGILKPHRGENTDPGLSAKPDPFLYRRTSDPGTFRDPGACQ